MLLQTQGVAATVPMLRGVWGRALHELDRAVYDQVFGDERPAAPAVYLPRGNPAPECVATELAAAPARAKRSAGLEQPPAETPGDAEVRPYLLRPAPPDPQFAPALDFLLFGPALSLDQALCRAWDVACGMGLGPRRTAFFIREAAPLDAAGNMLPAAQTLAAAATFFTLDQTLLPLPDQEKTPCRLAFFSPLRLRRHGRLVECPALPDLVAAANRRVRAFLPEPLRPQFDLLAPQLLEQARRTRATQWRGDRLDLRRYSGRQRAELDLHGVIGSLDLPTGAGPLAPLLAAAQFLHLGKATVMGLGQLVVLAL
jgi:hypothetical protein